MDDANMPNLLWIPYVGYNNGNGLYHRTRDFILSANNKNYFRGGVATGLGSQHHSFGLSTKSLGQCTGSCIWHLGLIMQGMTATGREERRKCMQMILATDADQGLLHEGFDP